MPAADGAADLAQAWRTFTDPPADARPMMRWWWFGPDVEREELERELTAMAAAGLGGVEVAFVYPLRATDRRFLDERMLADLRWCAERCRELGLRFDVTLGSGWSYGGPHIGPEHASRRLRWERRDIGPEALAVPASGSWPGDELVAAFVHELDWAPLPLDGAELQIPAGRGPRSVLLAWSEVTGQQVKRAAAGAEGPVLDHLSREATLVHLEAVGVPILRAVPAELIGSVFCDSLEVYGAAWTPRMPEEFARRRGYELLPLLHLLEVDAPGAEELRADVGRTLTELVEENFIATCTAWAREHGAEFRLQGYGEPPVTVSSNRFSALIEGEGVGWDQLTQLRWASSAAHLHGRGSVSSEVWTWVHSPSFRATPLDLKGEAHDHLLQGSTQLIGHGWPYSPPDAPGQGWYFYAAGALDDRNPWWPAMPELSAYLTRLCGLLRLGEPVADVLMLLPIEDVRREQRQGVDLWRALRDRIGPEIPATIRRAGYDLDVADDEALAQIDPARARVVVLPRTTVISEDARRWLEAARAAGAAVLQIEDAAELAEQLPAALAPDLEARGGHGEIGMIHRRLADGDLHLVANTGSSERTLTLTPRDAREGLELWDPRRGTRRPSDGTVTLAPYEAVVLVAGGAQKGSGPQAGPRTELPVGGWLLEGRPVHLPHRWEDEDPRASGTRTYAASVTIEPEQLRGTVELDLGATRPEPMPGTGFRAEVATPVGAIAEVIVGGRRVGVLWDAPFRLDITEALHPGENRLELRVSSTAAGTLAADPHREDVVAASRRRYGLRFEQQELERALDHLSSGLLAAPMLRISPPAASR